ncbi:Proposed peptidoglycan lipid II flippase MurJ [hydrothermal vent metagenome]|uniref:Proposed peptidoglycan lipid II flippase MurJ n=1 Tax=hydrothermal vent metagenome TaxID=652676 RepID=A0A3B0T1B2_9ZZZZ
MNLIRSAATVGGMTAISRVLGFGRDVLIAANLGTGPVADAFFVAFRFPNLFRRLFAEGAFNSAFVPLFAGRLEKSGPKQARQFGNEALSVLFWALLIVSGVAELAMPWLMVVIAPGFIDDPAKYDLAVVLTRIAFPYLAFMSLTALFSGVLNSMGKFAAAAAAPIILNIVLIATLFGVDHFGLAGVDAAGIALVWGVSAAGALQLLMVYIASRRAGMNLRLVRPRLTPGVRRLVVLGIPGIIAGGITQINIMVGTIIASLQDAAVSYLYYADRVYQLPLGLVGVAIGVVLLPDLSRRLRAASAQAGTAARNGEDGAIYAMNRALEISMLLTVPAAVALTIIPHPVISVLFERGAFTSQDTHASASALAAFAFGLPAFVMIKVLSPGFFAREDTRTPMLFAGVSVIVNIAVSLALFFVIGHVGIAVATTLAGWVNAGLLLWTLYRRGHYSFDARLARRLPLIGLASAVMAAALWTAADLAAPWLAGGLPFTLRAGVLAGLVVVGIAVFWLGAEVTGAAKWRELASVARRK